MGGAADTHWYPLSCFQTNTQRTRGSGYNKRRSHRWMEFTVRAPLRCHPFSWVSQELTVIPSSYRCLWYCPDKFNSGPFHWRGGWWVKGWAEKKLRASPPIISLCFSQHIKSDALEILEILLLLPRWAGIANCSREMLEMEDLQPHKYQNQNQL